jgi:hypothetical protein
VSWVRRIWTFSTAWKRWQKKWTTNLAVLIKKNPEERNLWPFTNNEIDNPL